MKIPLERTSMCWGITGSLGAGKTLTAAYLMVNVLREHYPNCHITTNVELCIDEIAHWMRVKPEKIAACVTKIDWTADPFAFMQGSPRGTQGVLFRSIVCLDEVAEMFDQYTSAKDGHVGRFLSWLRHSSKMGQDVFLIVQSQAFMNKSLRLLVARWVVAHNAEHLRLPVLHCRIPFCYGKSFITFTDKYGESFGEPTHFLIQAFWGRFYATAQILSAHGVSPTVSPAIVGRTFDGAGFALALCSLVLVVLSAVSAVLAWRC